MFDRRWLVVMLASCSSPEESISFDHADGTAKDLGDCVCEYHDGTDGDFSLEVTCTGGGEVSAISMFADPRNTTGEGDGTIILIPASQPADYAGGAGATISAIGDNNHSSSTRVIRDMPSVAFRWAEQDVCNVSYGCQIDSYHLLAGSLSGGHGACEDYYATQMLLSE